MELYDGQGRRVTLGRVLGRGGEGSVHEVPSISPHLVAKVYHGAISPEKQAKLRAMVARADDRLKEMLAFVELMDGWYSQMLTVPKSSLAPLIRLGARVFSFLPAAKKK